jgi:hypothetical protein
MAQERNLSARATKLTSSDVRISKTKPHVFINFERKGRIEPLYLGESSERVWLRFNNNSKWKIMFCSNPVPKEYGHMEVIYEIDRYKGPGGIPGTRSSDTCGYFLLDAGKSILFSVPQEHLADGLAVKVQFRYEWEIDPDGADNLLEPKHYTYFYSEDIPKSKL